MAKKTAAKKVAKKKVAKKLDPKFIYKHIDAFKYVPDEVTKYYRDKLRATNEFVYVLGSGYHYSQTGLDLMCDAMGLRKAEVGIRPADRKWVQIDGIPVNPLRLKCLSIGEFAKRVNVKVKDSSKFRSGDFIRVHSLIGDSAVLDMKQPQSLGVYRNRG